MCQFVNPFFVWFEDPSGDHTTPQFTVVSLMARRPTSVPATPRSGIKVGPYRAYLLFCGVEGPSKDHTSPTLHSAFFDGTKARYSASYDITSHSECVVRASLCLGGRKPCAGAHHTNVPWWLLYTNTLPSAIYDTRSHSGCVVRTSLLFMGSKALRKGHHKPQFHRDFF